MEQIQRQYEVVITLGGETKIIPATWRGIPGVAFVMDYGDNNCTSGDPPFNDPEHSLTRIALNEVSRLLRIRADALPRRPLSLGEKLTVEIREVAGAP